jgi:hypothetical protein
MDLIDFEEKIASPDLSSTYQDLLNILEILKEQKEEETLKQRTLHKALYEFATIFLTKILCKKWNYYKSITSFVKNDDCPLNRDESFVLKAYCLVAYRHKIIAHNNYMKIENGDALRNELCSGKFNDLKLKYQSLIPPDLNNDLEIVNELFYSIPLKDSLGKWNLDREAIDMIVQEVGCK